MKVLVLGGTGAMGVHLVEKLAQQKVDTYVTSRSFKENRKNINYLQGNAKDFTFLENILKQKWDAIVDFMVYSTIEFDERLPLLLNATYQYIFLSSARVYANSEKPLIEESPRLLDISTDPEYLNTDEYSLAKARQENSLFNSGKKNWTIVRPYITYDKERMQLGVLEKEEWLYRALKGRTIVFSRDIITKITTLTYGFDVSSGIFTLIGNPDAYGNAYHITNPDSTSWEKILNIYLEILEYHLGYRPKVSLENLVNFTAIHPAKYQIGYDRMFNRQFDNSKIDQIIDMNSFSSVEEKLSASLQAFLLTPNFKSINWELEAVKDKLCKEKTPLTEIAGFKNKLRYTLYRYPPQHLISNLKKLIK